MIVKFPDNKALVFAYSDLIALGIPKKCITPCFEEVGFAVVEDPAVHHAFLEELHQCFCDSPDDPEHRRTADVPMPLSPRFRGHGGVLKLQGGQLAMQTMAIVVQYDGELVG